jgi:ABC-type glutathione transport system ATPase component
VPAVLEARDLHKTYGGHTGTPIVAVNAVSLAVRRGEAVGLVGESGSGKTTVIQCLTRLTLPDSGTVAYDDVDVLAARGAALKRFRRKVQLVFQDPYVSLNPRMTAGQLVGEGLVVHRLAGSSAARRERVGELLEMVGLPRAAARRYPSSFSGGQRQRIAIARALAVEPEILICDEPVASLDVSVQAQIINLLGDLQQAFELGILLVAHDLPVVDQLCDRVVVMEHGTVVESGTRDEIFGAPKAPYTRALLDAVPSVALRRADAGPGAAVTTIASPGGERG